MSDIHCCVENLCNVFMEIWSKTSISISGATATNSLAADELRLSCFEGGNASADFDFSLFGKSFVVSGGRFWGIEKKPRNTAHD